MTKIVGRLLNSVCIMRNLLFWKKNLLYFNSDMSLSMELLYISYHSFMVYSNTFKKFNIQIRNTVLKYQKSFTNYSKHWWWDKIKPYFQTFWIKNKIMWEPLWLSHEVPKTYMVVMYVTVRYTQETPSSSSWWCYLF